MNACQDRMESFWLAETLKYTYMLQLDTADSIDLEKYVMNTVSNIISFRRPVSDTLAALHCLATLCCRADPRRLLWGLV